MNAGGAPLPSRSESGGGGSSRAAGPGHRTEGRGGPPQHTCVSGLAARLLPPGESLPRARGPGSGFAALPAAKGPSQVCREEPLASGTPARTHGACLRKRPGLLTGTGGKDRKARGPARGSRGRRSAPARPLPRQSGPAPRVAKGSDVTTRWRRLLQAAEVGIRPGRSESIRGWEKASGVGKGRSRGGGARSVPSAAY